MKTYTMTELQLVLLVSGIAAFSIGGVGIIYNVFEPHKIADLVTCVPMFVAGIILVFITFIKPKNKTTEVKHD